MAVQKFSSAAVNINHLYQISRIVTETAEWKPALDEIASLIRSIFIFDNLVVYLANPPRHDLDVMYARAMGRGRSAEADISWGESVANEVMDHPKTIMREPSETESADRLQHPYVLGVPLQVVDRTLGVLIFVRFGGPPFEPDSVFLSEYISRQISFLVELQNMQRAYDILQTQSQEARLQEDFISTITHELRTPLGFIKGYTTTLLRADTSWDAPTQQEFLRIIDQEADRLQELIENLLDSARLQSGAMKMDFQPVRIDALVRSVTDRLTQHFPGLQVVYDDQREDNKLIRGAPRRLGQVFENLINNAMKYAPGSLIYIRFLTQAEGVEVEVEDHGPGVPQRYLTHLFDRFFRNPELEPYVHGTGLGLFICKKIVLAHDGQIYATSHVGEGTTFHIQLPYLHSNDE